jgi:predicted nucleic acid-binding protein
LSEFFVDTSALAKRYVIEIGSAWLKTWIEPTAKNTIYISGLALAEMTSVIMRRQREGYISEIDSLKLRNDFLIHVEKEYWVVDIDSSVLSKPRDLLINHPLRTLDAIQLASALQAVQLLDIQPTFVSADTRLLTAAAAEGLPTDNPTAHP